MNPSPSSHPIRVARVITRFGVGGAALHVALLSRHLGHREFETTLFSGPTNAIEGDMLALRSMLARRGETSIRPHLIPSLRRDATPARDLRALRDLTRQFRGLRPDIVDTHLSKAGFLGRLAARIARVPAVIHTFHVNIFDGYVWNPYERELYRRLEQAAAHWSDRLICLSDQLSEEILNCGIGHHSQYRSIALGLDLTPFEPTPAKIAAARGSLRRELGLPSDALLVGLVSRLVPVKSVKTFVQAAALLRQSQPHITFLVIGDGEIRPRLEALSNELQLGQHLRFLGLRADISHLNLGLDAVALTSLQEGTPISIIESLAAARPVVATDVGGVSRLIDHEQTGLLVPPENPTAVARSLERVLGDTSLAKRLGDAGREKMRREFGIERLVAQTSALYREVVAEKGRAWR